MTGNAVDVPTVRIPRSQLAGDNKPCDQCGAPLCDHGWVDLDNGADHVRVVDCSGEVP
jgi:hypothetical protein